MTCGNSFSRTLWIAATSAVLLANATASAQIKVVAYNCYHNPDSTSDPYWNQQLANYGSTTWHDAYYGAGNYGTIPQRPTIMCLTECNTSLQGEPDSVSKVKTILNSIYGGEGANYQSVQIHAGSYEDYAFIYDASKVNLLDTATVTGGYRPTLRGHFQPVGYTSTNSDFYIYNCHLKALPGYETGRQGEVNAMLFRDGQYAANKLPSDANIMYVGDFNFTTSWGEPGYDLLLDPYPGVENPGVAFDPLADVCFPPYGGSSPSAYSTYSATGPWSRIDFQFPTTELGDGEGMDYIDTVNGLDSCHAHGNKNGSTSGYQAAQFASDHLPVIADYQLPAWMEADADGGGVTSPVIVGASASVNVSVENIAPVIHVAGADELDYAISGSGVVTGSAAGSDAALGGGNAHAIALDTTTAGLRTGQVNVTSTSPAVQDGSHTEPVSIEVLDHSEGSWNGGVDVNLLELDLGSVPPGAAIQSESFDLHNLAATAGYTADLDVDSVSATGDTAQLHSDLAIASIAAGGSESFQAFLETSMGQGLFNAQYIVEVSDEDLSGATDGTDMVLRLTGYVAIDGDLDLDKKVDGFDLNTLLANYGQTGTFGWADGDITGDGTVDGFDLNALLGNYGTDLASPTAVPEPSLALLVGPAVAVMAVRRRGSRFVACP